MTLLPPSISPTQLRSAEATTRRLAKSHYENFLVASVLLPRRLRQPFYNVYAFCRTADDLADESGSPELALEHLVSFGQQLAQTFAGNPPSDLFIALANTIEQFDLPRQPFEDLLDAFRQDQHQFRYADSAQLLDYCRRSANPVGRLVLWLGGALDGRNGELADQICTGLQLANFWQDVKRDYAIGRIYLPQDQMERWGVDEAMFQSESTAWPLRHLIRQQCDEAETLFHAGLGLADQVPKWLAADVKLFAHGGLATLNAIRKIEFDVLRVRPTVSKRRQLGLMARAAMGWL